MTVSQQSICPHRVDGKMCVANCQRGHILTNPPPCLEMEQQRDEGTEKGESQNTQSIQQPTRKSTKIKLMQMIRSSLWAVRARGGHNEERSQGILLQTSLQKRA